MNLHLIGNKYLFFFLIFFFLIIKSKESKPKISIITSIYKGEKYIKHFLEDITKQTIFNQCELILINANSSENEEKHIKPFLSKHKNIIYKRLKQNTSIYKAWNIAIKLANGKYITNSNLDDRLAHYCFEFHSKFLDENSDIDLVYSDGYFTDIANQTFFDCNITKIIFKPSFSKLNLKYNCLPSFNPMWRKKLHKKFGLFNENFKIAGDWEFWIRVVSKGSVFKKLPGIYGVAYNNPNGLSTNPLTVMYLEREKNIIRSMYKSFFLN